MKHLTALLVDDERLARSELRGLLLAHPEIDVVGEAADVVGAVARVGELSPEVLFLDIQMPGGSGFEILERLPSACRVVFVTAYSEHALRAFDVNALDYLLKPVHPARLAETVQRLFRDGETPRSAPPARPALHRDDPLIFPTGDHYQVVRVNQILCIHAAKDHSEVVTADGRRTLVSRSLRSWEESLPTRHFLKIHRSTIVNVDAVDRIEPWFQSSFRVYLRRLAEPLVVSRRFAPLLRERLV